ncbi:MAG: hypothetical protein KBF89_07740 [Acidimicrobiia bacterium]|nr:hypothetical protein [Acidimicrobiia bacterium]
MRKKLVIIFIFLILISTSLNACSKSKVKATGALKKTDYCAYYREFEDKVPTASTKQQLKLLEKLASAKDFPQELKSDYTQIISSYKKVIAGDGVMKQEKKNEKASNEITRHAIENCEILKSNSSSGGGI